MNWKTNKRVQLQCLSVELSEPVLVKRSRWYCWFPSLIRQPDGTLWAVMSAYADIHVSDSFCYLSRSKDGGLTWDEPRVIGDAGLSHLLLPDGSAMVIPYYLRPRPGGAIGAPCNIISPQGQLTMRPSGVSVTGWPRPPKSMGPELATSAFVFNGQVVRGGRGEYLTTLYGTFEGDIRFSLVFVESADGFAWRVRSLIAGAECPLKGEEGPCESAVCRLVDGRLMCVFRLSSSLPYGQSWSENDGRTWTKPAAMPASSVEPSLQVMPGGVIALSGGRPGISVWFSVDGGGTSWQAVDVMAHHNACRPQDAIKYTSGYTELMRVDDHHLILIYDRNGHGSHPIPDGSDETNSVWVMRITVDK